MPFFHSPCLGYQCLEFLQDRKPDHSRAEEPVQSSRSRSAPASCYWNAKHLDLSLGFDEYEIEADPELLKEVWINLLDNAVKFAPEYGLIRVTIQTGSESIRVAVSNIGSTIPPEKRDRIFQKFYQADESHATQGNGVGLAIVKKVVELHQGQVHVGCDENSTTFTVVLLCFIDG